MCMTISATENGTWKGTLEGRLSDLRTIKSDRGGSKILHSSFVFLSCGSNSSFILLSVLSVDHKISLQVVQVVQHNLERCHRPIVVIVLLFISRGLETLSNLKWKRIASPEGSSINDVRMGRGCWMLQVMFVYYLL